MSEVCEKCGSDKIIENLPLPDRNNDLVSPSSITIQGGSQGLFKRAVRGLIYLRVCCDCGRAEVHVSNGHDLWQAHSKRTTQ
jgi:hypothetical protein